MAKLPVSLICVGFKEEITFETTISDSSIHNESKDTINRKLWGIEYAGKADNLIKDDVAIIASDF